MINKKKYFYKFQQNNADGNIQLKNLLGKKGIILAKMCNIGIPIPPGFTISTTICSTINNKTIFNHYLFPKIVNFINNIGQLLDLKFNNQKKPLLISVRSSSCISMPGMMDTILNIGINDNTVVGLAKIANNDIFAYDCYKRFIEIFSYSVCNLNKSFFNTITNNYKKKINKKNIRLGSLELKSIIFKYKNIFLNTTGKLLPENSYLQLSQAIVAVFNSYYTPRAIKYRKINTIDNKINNSIIIQTMVFGNKGSNSASGVIFSRNPSNGQKKQFGEYLINTQGEDIVGGYKTPSFINNNLTYNQNIKNFIPKMFKQLTRMLKKLENNFQDMQDVEFTIECGKLWILQARPGKRTINAAIKIAIDMYKEGIIKKKKYILKTINPNNLTNILHAIIIPKYNKKFITKGLPSSPGAVSGIVVLNSQKTSSLSIKHSIILIRIETSPDDIAAIHYAKGIVTCKGGITSHAAVVARGMGKVCITGTLNTIIDINNNQIIINSIYIKEGEKITIDGTNGEIFLGVITTIQSKISLSLKKILNISKELSSIKIYVNAERIKEFDIAFNFGAQGIGLCRTEHMFFTSKRINFFRKMIFSNNKKEKKTLLNKIELFQTNDFYHMFKKTNSKILAIRLLDLPLHEFLPEISNKKISLISSVISVSIKNMLSKIKNLHEFNPMLGHRGCRLAITNPEIYKMQISAIFKAILQIKNIPINPEIIIPLIINKSELFFIKKLILDLNHKLSNIFNIPTINFKIGSMIEVPSAIINISDIVSEVDFINFGTNDLTQLTLGMSRDDSIKFLKSYYEKKIILENPFETIDKNVLFFIKKAIQKAKEKNPNIKIGICGEHAADPKSIKQFIQLPIDYLSCSAYKIPIAQIAIAKYNK